MNNPADNKAELLITFWKLALIELYLSPHFLQNGHETSYLHFFTKKSDMRDLWGFQTQTELKSVADL